MGITKFHRLSRAVIINHNNVLLAKAKGFNLTFLPGGHIEIWEGAEDALIREIKEEMGIDVSIKRFLGDIEHQWESNGVTNLEINHIFEVTYNGTEKIDSQEGHLEFFWVDIQEIHQHNLQPSPLVEMLKNIKSVSSYWVSSLK